MNFTYGFELEGLISKELGDELNFSLGSIASGNREYFKQDGSVRIVAAPGFTPFKLPEVNCNCGHCTTYLTEYASPVFPSLASFIAHLKKFNNKHYQQNPTCGLHVGFGSNQIPEKTFQTLIANYDLWHKVKKMALELCKCQRDRLKNKERMRYYRPFMDRKETKSLLMLESPDPKHRFVHWHQHYLELRFLSPCEHKVENVTEILTFLTDYLMRKEKKVFSFPFSSRDNNLQKNVIKFTFKNPSLKQEVVNLGDVSTELPEGFIWDALNQKYICNVPLMNMTSGSREVFPLGSIQHGDFEDWMNREMLSRNNFSTRASFSEKELTKRQYYFASLKLRPTIDAKLYILGANEEKQRKEEVLQSLEGVGRVNPFGINLNTEDLIRLHNQETLVRGTDILQYIQRRGYNPNLN